MLIIRRHVKVISKVSPTWFVRLIGVVFLELGMAPWHKCCQLGARNPALHPPEPNVHSSGRSNRFSAHSISFKEAGADIVKQWE